MLTSEEHDGENDNKEIQYNKYFTMAGKFKAEAETLNLKVMTSKKGKQKVIRSNILYGKHSNNKF